MLPTRLTVWLFLLGLLPPLAGVGYALLPNADPTVTTALYLLVLAYDVGLLLLCVADARLARRAFTIRVTRERPPRLSVGVDNEVVLLLENRGGRAVQVLVRDEPPPGFR